jgi:hypothetical protein
MPGARGWLLVDDVIGDPRRNSARRLRRIEIPGYADTFEVSIYTVLGHIMLPIEMQPTPDGLVLETAGTVLLAATWAELRFREPVVRVPAESPCTIAYRNQGRG